METLGSDYIYHLADDLRELARFRREKALQQPEDPRNLAAAQLASDLADDIEKSVDTAIARELAELRVQWTEELQEHLSEYHRTIGFSVHPRSAYDYLEDIIDVLTLFKAEGR